MKKFLALFAIVSMLIGMYADLGYTLPAAGEEYILNVDNSVITFSTETAIKVTASTGIVGNLEGCEVAIYNADGTTLAPGISAKPISYQVDEYLATFPGTEIMNLPLGKYYIKVSSGVTTIDSGTEPDSDQVLTFNTDQTARVKVASFEIKTDTQKITEALALIPANYTPGYSATEVNLVDWVHGLIAGTGTTVDNTVQSTNEAAVSTAGIVNFGSAEATADVTFTVRSGLESNSKTVAITVSKTDAQKITEALALIPANYTPGYSATEVNLVDWVNGLIAGTGTTVDNAVLTTNEAAVSTAGIVNFGSAEANANVTFTIHSGSESNTKAVAVTVPAKSDAQKITDALALIPANYTPGYSVTEVNLLNWVNGLISGTDTTVGSAVLTTNEAAVSTAGIVNFGLAEANANVTFTIHSGSESSTKAVAVTVPAKSDTQKITEALALIPANYTPEYSVTEVNLVDWVHGLIAGTGTTVDNTVSTTNEAAVSTTGIVNFGSAETIADITFTVRSGLESNTKTVAITVSKTDDQKITEALALIPANYTPGYSATEVNLVDWVHGLIAGTGTTVDNAVLTTNEAAVSTTGIVHFGSVESTADVTFTIHSGSESNTKVIAVTVPTKSDTQKITDALALIPANYTLGYSATEVNLVDWLHGLIAGTGTTVDNTVQSTNEAAVSTTGIVHFGSVESTADVTFTINSGSESSTKAVAVTVPAKSDAQKITDALALIPADYTPEYSATEVNLVNWANGLISGTDTTVDNTVQSTNEVAVSTTGIVHFGSVKADANVTFTVHSGSESNTKAVAVVVQAKDLQQAAIDKIKAYAESSSNPAPELTDYEDAGVTGAVLANLASYNIAVEAKEAADITDTASIQAIVTEVNDQVNKDQAIAKIKAYAESSSNPVPELTDYEDAGVTGAVLANLASYNIAVDAKEAADITDTASIQAIITEVNNQVIKDQAIAKIKAYAESTSNPEPVLQDYHDAGVTGAVADKLAYYNTAVAGKSAADITDTASIQAIVTAANAEAGLEQAIAKIKAYAASSSNPVPVLQDYHDAGVTDAVLDNLAAYNTAVAEKDESDITGTTSIQTIVSKVNALVKIKAYAASSSNPAPVIKDYEDAGVLRTAEAKLTRYNNAVNLAEPTEVDTTAELQTLVDNINKELSVVLDNHENIEYTKSFGFHNISGKILDEDGILVKVDAVVRIVLDNNDGLLSAAEQSYGSGSSQYIDEIKVEDGYFSKYVNTNQTGQFLIYGVNSKDAYFANDPDDASSYDRFRILPEVELIKPYVLEWNYGVDGQQVVQGDFINEDCNLTDSNGKYEKHRLTLNYIDPEGEETPAAQIAVASYIDEVTFGFLFDGESKLNKTGEIGLYYDGILLLKGEVKAGDLKVAVTDRVTNNLGKQELVFSFDLPDGKDGYVTKSGTDYKLNSDYTIEYVITDEDNDNRIKDTDGDYFYLPEGTLISGGQQFEDGSNQRVSLTHIDFTEWPTDEYLVKLELKKGSVVVKEKEIDFRVVRPASYNLINWNLEEHQVASINMTFEETDTADNTYPIIVRRDMSADGLCPYLEVIAKGCGVDETFVSRAYDTEDGVDEFTIDVTETGTLKLQINVYNKKGDTSPKKVFKKEVEIKGWNVRIVPSKVTVDTEEDITIYITDEDGKPVNNAIIRNGVNGDILVNGAKTNIIGGVYEYEDDEENLFESVGDLELVFIKDDEVQVTLEKGIQVLGEDIYTVFADTPILLNSIEEKIYVTVIDEYGDIAYPSFTRIDIDDKGQEGDPIPLRPGTRKDLDGDGTKEAVRLTLTPNKDQVKMIIRATTGAGKQKGDLTLKVEPPYAVMKGADTATENFKTDLMFKIIDPRDNSIIDNDVYFKADEDYISFSVEDEDDDPININEDNQSASIYPDNDYFTCQLYVEDVNWQKVEKDDAEAVVSLMMDIGDDKDVKLLDIPVKEASLISDPETIVMNTATNLTLTYLDGQGQPLVGYEITLGDTEIGETNNNGQLFYAASSVNSVSLTFEAETDDKHVNDGESGVDQDKHSVADEDDPDTLVTTLKIKSGADVSPPVASYELLGNTAIITITDNVRLSKSMVNGELVNMFLPMPTVTHVVNNLKTGVNKIEVLAGDVNNNYLQTTLTITVVEPLSLTVGKQTKYGTPLLMQNTTMVPVRFAEDLGAVVEWNNATQTVTYTKNEIQISMTIGNSTATVSGKKIKLPVAPFKNSLGRTMVPLRMIAQELGFTVEWVSNDAPIKIK